LSVPISTCWACVSSARVTCGCTMTKQGQQHKQSKDDSS
jgi:hypothetical protein